MPASRPIAPTHHTPGPWFTREAGSQVAIMARHKDGLAERLATTEALLDESDANAKLIAAAPEMLAFLDMLLTYEPGERITAGLLDMAAALRIKAAG